MLLDRLTWLCSSVETSQYYLKITIYNSEWDPRVDYERSDLREPEKVSIYNLVRIYTRIVPHLWYHGLYYDSWFTVCCHSLWINQRSREWSNGVKECMQLCLLITTTNPEWLGREAMVKCGWSSIKKTESRWELYLPLFTVLFATSLTNIGDYTHARLFCCPRANKSSCNLIHYSSENVFIVMYAAHLSVYLIPS